MDGIPVGQGGGAPATGPTKEADLPVVKPGCGIPYRMDNDGNCVRLCPVNYRYDIEIKGCVLDKPCDGDPVKNPEIAPQTNSGIEGGMHDTCARKDDSRSCKGVKGSRWHNGVDIKNTYGAPVHAVHAGTASKYLQPSGAGYYVAVVSQINDATIRMVYFHLQEAGRASGELEAGDIVGYQGDSGNLKEAIEEKFTVSHVHIKAQKNGAHVDPLEYFHTQTDPVTGQVTNPCN